MGVIDLPFTGNLPGETDRIFHRVEQVIPRVEWPLHAPYVAAINRLKHERNAVILAHNYQVPEIFYTVADIVGDSLALAMQAAKTDAEVIVLCGVHFMAETAKLVNPSKTVLVPDLRAGCSLAESITAADVRLLREKYPGTPVVTYVNTSAEVKAESDVCVTSGNAVRIVEALGRLASSSFPTSTSPSTWHQKRTSRSLHGRGTVKCTSASAGRTFAVFVKAIRRSWCLPIQNVRPTCLRKQITSALRKA
jgi:hypothetical protein